MRRRHPTATGLEAAPDIMLLTMAALMVAIVWLVSHAHEATLPPIDLPESSASQLGASDADTVSVTLRPDGAGGVLVFVEDAPLPGGVPELAAALEASGAHSMTLRADANTPWQPTLDAMTAAAEAGLSVQVAAEP